MRKSVVRVIGCFWASALLASTAALWADDGGASDESKKKSRGGSSQFGIEFLPLAPKAPLTPPALPTGPAAQPQPKVPESPQESRGLLPPLWSAIADSFEPPVEPAPSQVSPAAGTQGLSIQPAANGLVMPKFGGIYLTEPLEREMWQAAQSQDFERAIQVRDRIREIKQNTPWWDQAAALEGQMREAASSLNFERAIELREQIRELQSRTIASDAPQAVEPEPRGPVFQVQGFEITGNELFADQELMPYLSPLTGKDITLRDIRDAASEIKRHYREAGYIAAYVYIPPQTVENGIVKIEVIEGTLGEVRVHGNRYFSSELISRQLQLPMDRPITFGDIQNRLLKLDEHRDIDLKATFVPGKTPGTSDLDLEVQDHYPLHGSIDMNNYGTELAGQERIGLSVTHTNLLGAMDELYARGQFSEGSSAYAVDYSVPFLNPDMRIGASYVYGNLDLQGAFKALNVDGQTQTIGIYTTMPLYDTSNFDANLKLGLDHKSSENSILDFTTGKDELRIANAIVTLDQKDAWGRTVWPHGLHLGLDAFGASEKNQESLTRAHTGAPFLIYRSQIQRMFYLFKDMALRFKGAWQLTPDQLPPSEQFQIGGFDSVRGYPQGEYLGDYGAVLGSEVAVPFYGLPRHWRLPYQKEPLYDNLRFVTFYDFGTADLRGALPGESSKKDISGAGLGLRLRVNETLYAQVGWAFPMADTPSDGSDSAFYFGLSADLF